MTVNPIRHPWIRAGILGGLLLTFAASLPAQRVSPVIVEYEQKAESRFTLENVTLVPANVILEAQSFTLSEDGDPTFRPLDEHIKVKLSAMSLRLPAKQNRFVFYEAEAETLPAWFVINSTFRRGPAEEGTLGINFRISHTVYLMQKEPLTKEDIRVLYSYYEVNNQRIIIILENNSPRLGRAFSSEVRSGRKSKSHGSFPLFPNSRRRIVFPWEGPEIPGVFTVRFKDFNIQSGIWVCYNEPLAGQNSSP